jgi:3-oxoacyl-[acyl-carrier protein] reductase
MTPFLSFAGRVALVTGAGQGVGRAIALGLARQGAAAVIVNDFYAERAEAVTAEVREAGAAALAVAADVSDLAAVRAMVAAAEREHGRVDVLVNNAGNAGPGELGELKAFWDAPEADWPRWLATNLYGVLNLTHAVLPGMTARGYGRVVTIISDAGRVGEPHLATYAAAKGGAAAFTRSIAKAGGRYGITANNVALGAISTPGLEARLSDPERRKKVLSHYLIRRLGEAEDAANAVVFLASDAASWITGQTLPVNGGYALTM